MMDDKERLSRRLARGAGLPEDLAEIVLETARDYVKARHPELADDVDALFADRRGGNRLVRMIARLGRRADPRRTSPPESER
jgi:hypothetical protein